MRKISEMILKYNAVLGVVSLLVLVIIPALLKIEEPWQKILISVGTSIFVGLTVSYFLNMRVKDERSFETEVLLTKYFPLFSELDKIGLTRILYHNNLKVEGIDIVGPAELYLVMNDGKNFYSSNTEELSRRFKLENKKTVLIFLDGSSDSQRIISRRHGKTDENYYSSKINVSIQDFQAIHNGAPTSNTLEIRKNEFYCTMSIVATENWAISGMYRNAAGKELKPLHFYFNNNGNESEYAKIMNDIVKLLQLPTESHLTSSSTG